MSKTNLRARYAITAFAACVGMAGAWVAHAQDNATDNTANDIVDNATDDAEQDNVADSAPATTQQAPACATPTFRAQLMTSTAGRIPRDVGVVVGLVPGGALSAVPPLSLTRRRRSIATRTEPIAPGLVRVIPDARRVAGRYTLTGAAGEPGLLFARAAVPPPPARPALERVERYLVASASGSRTELKAHFAFPIPAGVVAVLVYVGDATEPSLFARAVPTRNEAILFANTGCPGLPAGSTPPPESGSLRVAFVDLFGHVSQMSDPQSY